MHQYVTLEDTVYMGFGANLTSGAAGDGASPLFDVRLGGAAAGAIPVLSGTPTLLTHANYSDGCYEVAIAATAANGFAAGQTYLVFVTLTIDAVTPAAMIGSFRTAAVPANALQWNSLNTVALPLIPAVAGRTLAVDASGRALSDVDTIKTNPVVNAGTITFPTTATLASTTNITAGTITTTTNLTNLPTIPANWLTAAGTAADFGAELATAIWTDTTAGDFTVALSVGKSVMNGVALGTGLTINAYTGNTVQTGDSFARIGAAGAGLTAIYLPNQTMDIVGNITGNLSGSVGSVTGSVGSVTGAVGSVTGAVGSVTGAVGSVTANVNAVLTNGAHGGAAATAQFGGAGGITSTLTGNLTGSVGSVTGAVGSVTGAVGSVTGNVGGNVVGSVASVTATVNADVKKVNAVAVIGAGTSGDLWRA